MTFIKRWAKKYSNTIMCYVCAFLAELGGVGALLSAAFDRSRSGSLPAGGLYLVAIGILLGLLANSLAKGTQRKYRQLVEEIDLRGFSDPLLIRCEKSKSTRKLVEIIAEERNMTRQYSETLERHVLSHQ